MMQFRTVSGNKFPSSTERDVTIFEQTWSAGLGSCGRGRRSELCIIQRLVWSFVMYVFLYLCFFLGIFSRRRSPSSYFWSILWNQTGRNRRGNSFLHSLGTATNHLWHSVATSQRPCYYRLKGFAKCKHYIAYLVSTSARSIAQNIQHPWTRLRRESVAIHYDWSPESRRCSVRCWRAYHAAWNGFPEGFRGFDWAC